MAPVLDHGSVDEVDARQPVQLQNGVARLSKQAALATWAPRAQRALSREHDESAALRRSLAAL